jgi:hypothetical protein
LGSIGRTNKLTPQQPMENTKTRNSTCRRDWIDLIGFFLGWFSIIGQFVLILQNRQTDVFESIIRFFSFFTILTNVLVAFYFTSRIPVFHKVFFQKIFGKGTLTALTVFILVVGLVYQIILRQTWNPTGFQRIIDELLHSVIPFFLLLYWLSFAAIEDIKFQNFKNWLWFPLLYFVFIIISGHFSNFYPYPFINAREIGYFQVFINFLIVSGVFLSVMGILIFAGHKIKKHFKP